MGRLVAIKFLFTHDGPDAQRFLSEARVTAQCRHENIVVIYDVDEYHGFPYMVLEYIEGRTLRDVLKEQERSTANWAIEVILPVTRALACAHAMRIVHRDLKPENIMMSSAGQIKVLDFGIAKQVSKILSLTISRDAPENASLDTRSLQNSEIIGTFPYMAPEQWLGERLDARTDIWALGILLFELSTGRHPLTPQELITISDMEVPMPSLRDKLSDAVDLADIVDRCLKKYRKERFDSVIDVQRALEGLDQSRRSNVQLMVDGDSPYTGLSAFQESDALRFFGRDGDIAVTLGKLRHHPLVAVAGPSGSGKSSIVRAGVLPALKRSENSLETLTIRPGRNPLVALAEVLTLIADSAIEPGAEFESIVGTLRTQPGYLGARLRHRCRKRGNDHRIVLFIDQLEELYTLGIDADTRSAFCACIEGIADDASSPLRVIVTIRGDFLDRMSSDRRLMDEVMRGLIFLPPLGNDGLKDALLKPIESVGYRFEDDDLWKRMLRDLEGTKSPLPLLQFTAAKLWELRDKKARILTRQSYVAIGGIAGALSTHADSVFEGFNRREQALVRLILLLLVTPERTRKIVHMHEINALESNQSLIDAVMDRLASARLISIESSHDNDGKTVELIHESLIERWTRLRQWFDEDEQDAQLLAHLRSAAIQWEKSGQPEGMLWRDRAALEAEQWLERRRAEYGYKALRRIGETERRFLHAVIGLSTRSRQFRRGVTFGIVAAVGTLVIVFSILLPRLQEQTRAIENAVGNAKEAEIEVNQRRSEARDARLLAGYHELARAGQHHWAAKLLSEVSEPQKSPRWLRAANSALNGYDWTQLATTAPRLRKEWRGPEVSLRGATAPLQVIAWSHNGQYIAAGSDDGAVRVWRASGLGNPLLLKGHQGAVRSVAFSPDNRRLLATSNDGTARIWDNVTNLPTFTLLAGGVRKESIEIAASLGPLRGGAWSPDGSLIVLWGESADAQLVKSDGSERRVLHGHTDDITTAAFVPNRLLVITASRDRTARLWNLDATQKAVLGGHDAAVLFATPSSDGEFVLTGSADKTARIWSVKSGNTQYSFTGHDGPVIHAAWSPDGARVATASTDGSARIWKLGQSNASAILNGYHKRLSSVSFRADGRYVATTGIDEPTFVWPIDGGATLTLPGNGAIVQGSTFSPDGTRVLTKMFVESTCLSKENAALVWHPEQLEAVQGPQPPPYIQAQFDKTGERIFAITNEGQLKYGAMRNPNESLFTAEFGVAATFVRPSPDGKIIAIGFADGTTKLVFSSEKSARVLQGHSAPIRGIAWNSASTKLVTVADDHIAIIHSLDERDVGVRLSGHTEGVLSAAWSPNGKRIATTSADRTTRLWSAEKAESLMVFNGAASIVWDAAWSPDGRKVVTAADNGVVQILDVDTGKSIATMEVGEALSGVVWSPNGQWIAAMRRSVGVLLWRADDLREPVIAENKVHILAMAFINESRELVAWRSDDIQRTCVLDVDLAKQRIGALNADCLPEPLRVNYLDESPDVARSAYVACELDHGRTLRRGACVGAFNLEY